MYVVQNKDHSFPPETFIIIIIIIIIIKKKKKTNFEATLFFNISSLNIYFKTERKKKTLNFNQLYFSSFYKVLKHLFSYFKTEKKKKKNDSVFRTLKEALQIE